MAPYSSFDSSSSISLLPSPPPRLPGSPFHLPLATSNSHLITPGVPKSPILLSGKNTLVGRHYAMPVYLIGPYKHHFISLLISPFQFPKVHYVLLHVLQDPHLTISSESSHYFNFHFVEDIKAIEHLSSTCLPNATHFGPYTTIIKHLHYTTL